MLESTSQSTIVRYKASAPNAKYMGRQLGAFTDNIRADVIQPILEKYNIKDINPGEWMSAQLQLDMLRDIEAQCTFEELVAVGMKRGEFIPLPPEIDAIEKFLERSTPMYLSLVRDVSPDEKVTMEKLGNNYYRLTYHVPFPPFVMYGTTYGILKRLKKQGDSLVITIVDKNTPYIFDIKW